MNEDIYSTARSINTLLENLFAYRCDLIISKIKDTSPAFVIEKIKDCISFDLSEREGNKFSIDIVINPENYIFKFYTNDYIDDADSVDSPAFNVLKKMQFSSDFKKASILEINAEKNYLAKKFLFPIEEEIFKNFIEIFLKKYANI